MCYTVIHTFTSFMTIHQTQSKQEYLHNTQPIEDKYLSHVINLKVNRSLEAFAAIISTATAEYGMRNIKTNYMQHATHFYSSKNCTINWDIVNSNCAQDVITTPERNDIYIIYISTFSCNLKP